MEKINITKGQDYKVTHKETKQTYFFNAQEVADFIYKNNFQNYNIKEVKEKKFIDKVPEFIFWFAFAVLLTASIGLYIQLNY
jgi:predicted HTH transcriptional regulator